jgi:hypothetical protein
VGLTAEAVKGQGGACDAEEGLMDESELRARLSRLGEEHRDLDAAIAALADAPGADALQLMRLKKRKLRLKDEMQLIQDMLIPDIIA